MQHRRWSVAIGLVGHARSGKTTLARDLAALLPHTQLVSFGDVIRDRAGQLGRDSTDRSVLVDLGQRWVGEDPSELCGAVLSRADATARPLIIDGIRHRRIAVELAHQLRPRRLLVVYLDAPRQLLLQRLCAAGMTPQQAATLLIDPTELEIDGPLRALADVIVDATNSPAANLQYLLDNLARHGIATHYSTPTCREIAHATPAAPSAAAGDTGRPACSRHFLLLVSPCPWHTGPVTLDMVPPQAEDASPALPAVGLTVRADAIVAIVGHARAGKTRLAAAVAERFGDASVVGFGDAVRERAKVTRRVVDSDVLIEVGTKWVQRDPLGFCREVLNQQLGPSRLLLVEGIHHDVIRDALTHLVAPVPIRFVILKTPDREIVDRFQEEGKTAEQAARVLNDPTEVDVDRALLARADLVLDGTHPVPDNVDRVITLAQQLSGGRGPAATIVGGLDPQQRSELVEAVAAEFKWLLPTEAAEVLGISLQQIQRLHEQRELLGLQINGSLLYPSFTIAGHESNPAVAIVLRLLSPLMSDWELVAWLMADNGYLDGARPIDQPVERIQVAVDAELSNG